MITEVPFGEWLPDQADYKNPGLTVCDGCYPSGAGYAPALAPVATLSTISGDIRGAHRFERTTGTIATAIGTSEDLFIIVGGVTTASGLGLSLPEGVFWSFQRFNTQLWAFAYGVDPVYLADVDTDTTFAAHPGVAPQAASASQIGDFIVTGNMVDIDSSPAPYRVRWSQFNNPAGDYGTDIAVQSGFIDMPRDLGPVVGVFGGRFDVVLQKYGISRFTYTGGATVFRRDTFEDQRGCVSAPSVAVLGGSVYFLSNDGFCRTDGSSAPIISQGRVWEWFKANAAPQYLDRVQAAINWDARCIVWSFVPTEGTTYAKQIAYSWDSNRWSTLSLGVDWLFDTTEAGKSLEEVSAIYPDLDAMPHSLDSAEFKSRDRSFAGIIDGEVVGFNGAPIEATIETGEFQPKVGYRSCTQEITPLVENQDASGIIAIGTREVGKGAPVAWTATASLGSAGFAAIVKDGRYHRARLTIPAGAAWDNAIGLQVSYIVTGRT